MFGELDFSQLPNNMISGLEEEEINEISIIQELLRNETNESYNILSADVEESLNHLYRIRCNSKIDVTTAENMDQKAGRSL